MTEFLELVKPLRKAIYPVCFETGNEDAPFSTFGTCFLVELECGIFAVTLKHVVDKTHVSDLFIFDEADQIDLIKFKRRIGVECISSPASEINDLVLLEINPQTLKQPLPCYNLSKISNEWESEPKNYNYMVFGYPTSERNVDYEIKHIETVQRPLACVYSGKSMLEDCYKLKIDQDSISGTDDLDGYSGSPVFAWHKNASSVYEAVLCGVAIQGKDTTVNFLRRREIDEIARQICRADPGEQLTATLNFKESLKTKLTTTLSADDFDNLSKLLEASKSKIDELYYLLAKEGLEHSVSGRQEEAAQLFSRIFVESENDDALVLSFQFFMRVQEWNNADKVCLKIINNSAPGSEELAYAYSSRAAIHVHRGKYKKANRAFKKARQLFESLGMYGGIGGLYGTIGNAYLQLNELEEAKNYYEWSYKLHKHYSISVGEANDHNQLGMVNERLDHLEDALSHFKQAIELNEFLVQGGDFGRRQNLGNNYGGIGIVYRKMNNKEAMRDSWEQALALHESTGSKGAIEYIEQLKKDNKN